MEQHTSVMACRIFSWTEAKTENTGKQQLGSDVGRASSPNVDYVVTCTGPIIEVAPLQMAPPPTIVTIPTHTTTMAVTMTMAPHRDSSHVAHEEPPPPHTHNWEQRYVPLHAFHHNTSPPLLSRNQRREHLYKIHL